MSEIYESRKELGNAIQRERRLRGMSQEALARRIRKNPSYISKLETGRTLPGEETARALSKALDMDSENFLLSVALCKQPKRTRSAMKGQFASGSIVGEGGVVYGGPAGDKGAARLMAIPVRGEVRADPERQIEFFDGEDGPTLTLGASMDPPLGAAAYALQVSSRSMEPVIRPGQYVIADPSLEPKDGDLCIVHMKNGSRVFKRLRYNRIDPLQVRLQSQHADYDDEDCLWSAIDHCDVVRGAWYR